MSEIQLRFYDLVSEYGKLEYLEATFFREIGEVDSRSSLRGNVTQGFRVRIDVLNFSSLIGVLLFAFFFRRGLPVLHL